MAHSFSSSPSWPDPAFDAHHYHTGHAHPPYLYNHDSGACPDLRRASLASDNSSVLSDVSFSQASFAEPAPHAVDVYTDGFPSAMHTAYSFEPSYELVSQAFMRGFDPAPCEPSAAIQLPRVDLHAFTATHTPAPARVSPVFCAFSPPSPSTSSFCDSDAPGSPAFSLLYPASPSLSHSSPASSSSASDIKPPKKPKMHQCPVCAKWFPRPSGLATHMHTHSGAKPFRCPLPSCSKAFAVRSNAKRHLRTHGIVPASYAVAPSPGRAGRWRPKSLAALVLESIDTPEMLVDQVTWRCERDARGLDAVSAGGCGLPYHPSEWRGLPGPAPWCVG